MKIPQDVPPPALLYPATPSMLRKLLKATTTALPGPPCRQAIASTPAGRPFENSSWDKPSRIEQEKVLSGERSGAEVGAGGSGREGEGVGQALSFWISSGGQGTCPVSRMPFSRWDLFPAFFSAEREPPVADYPWHLAL